MVVMNEAILDFSFPAPSSPTIRVPGEQPLQSAEFSDLLGSRNPVIGERVMIGNAPTFQTGRSEG